MLSLSIFDQPNGALLADYTQRAQGLRFSTNGHGFAALRCTVPMDLHEAFTAYEWPDTPHVELVDMAAARVWEGRLEDVAIVPGGITLGAFGYWRALTDVPYTALWSNADDFQSWQPVTNSDQAAHESQKYEIDSNGRLHIALKKNEVYAASQLGGLYIELANNGERNDVTVSFDYELLLPNSNWELQIRSYFSDFSGASSTEDQIAGTGSLQSGSKSINMTSGRQIVDIALRWVSGGSYTMSDETGEYYAIITNVRIKTTTAATVLASDIAAALATYVNGINSNQLSASAALIEATSTDLQNELYEDATPADILDRLAGLHNYAAAVWADRLLTFAPLADQGRTYYVDVLAISDLQRSLDPLRNSVYAKYRDANGRTLRTAVADDAASKTKYGITRRGVVNVQTTDSTEAETHRDAYLTDKADYAVRAKIDFEHIYDASGARVPLYQLRAHDTLIMRNLPPTLTAGIDNIRSFRVGATEFNADQHSISIEPRVATPTLVELIAKKNAGI